MLHILALHPHSLSYQCSILLPSLSLPLPLSPNSYPLPLSNLTHIPNLYTSPHSLYLLPLPSISLDHSPPLCLTCLGIPTFSIFPALFLPLPLQLSCLSYPFLSDNVRNDCIKNLTIDSTETFTLKIHISTGVIYNFIHIKLVLGYLILQHLAVICFLLVINIFYINNAFNGSND